MTTSIRRPEDPEQLRALVREGYTRIADRASSCCGPQPHTEEVAHNIGYTDEDLRSLPEGANLGVGCGNPTAIDSLRAGEVVVDLGSGAGIDCFLAARQVGETGRVIGVDMTDAMLDRARENVRKSGATNIEFRKGKIEALPLDDGSADVVISNCVINLSPEKRKVFDEAHRVLRGGGRLMISDLVLEHPLPPQIEEAADAYLGCVGGASLRTEYLQTIRDAGFRDLQIQREASFADAISLEDPQVHEAMERFGITQEQILDLLRSVTSLQVLAVK
jgi:arsenite methyltransferase